MTVSVNGGFDQVVQIAASYLLEQARSQLSFAPAAIAVDDPKTKITGTIDVAVHDVWWRSPGERFTADTGAWQLVPGGAPAHDLVVGIELDSDRLAGTGLSVARITPAGATTPLTIPAAKQFLDLHAGVIVRLPVQAAPLHTRPVATAAFPKQPDPCIALVTSPFDLAKPDVEGARVAIVLDDKRLRASPFVTYLVDLANLVGLDPETVVIAPLRAELTARITEVVAGTLRTFGGWQVQEPGRVLLFAATDPMVTAADMLVDDTSLRVLLTLGGAGGDPASITKPILEGDDAFGICVNGTSLLRDTIRPVLIGIFTNLDDGDFKAGEPCTVAKRVLVDFGGTEVTLLYLQAGIDEDETLVIWLQFETEFAATRVIVEAEVPIIVSVTRVLAGTQQALSIATRIETVDYEVLAETSIPGWAEIVEAVVSGAIGGALGKLKAPNPFRQALPAGTELRVTGYSLHQDDAPRGTRTPPKYKVLGSDIPAEYGIADLTITTGGPVAPTPARWRDHDLVVRLGSRAYPRRLDVGCVIADGNDPGTRIDGLGGTYARGGGTARWSMTADDAIAYLRGGGTMVVDADGPNETTVVVVDAATPYLRTQRDTAATNNLVALPRCPPVVDAPVPDPASTPSKTMFSDTMVHWRDVLPFGGKGDETVNAGMTVPSGCRVTSAVVEMVDRAGTVLASAGPGADATVSGAGASLLDDPTGGRSLAVKVHWWFDAYHVCRYRVNYTVTGTTC